VRLKKVINRVIDVRKEKETVLKRTKNLPLNLEE
jgi:hypothetical protein